jgi:hypothetical protein
MPPPSKGRGRRRRPRASTHYARSDPRAANAALEGGKCHEPEREGGIMKSLYSRAKETQLLKHVILSKENRDSTEEAKT